MMKKFRLHTSLAKLLQPTISHIAPAVRTAGELLHNWENFAGKNIAAHSRPSFFDAKTNTLTIYCDSPEWNTALTINAATLLENLPRRYGVENIRTIYRKNWKVPPKESPPPPPVLPTLSSAALIRIQKKVKAQNLSPEISKAAEEFLMLCEQRRLFHD